MSDITLRRPTFKNPLPTMIRVVWGGLKKFFKAWIAAQEAHGRARAAHHLAAMGYYEEAKQVMLQGEKDA
jgi:hypothetical protein